MIFPERGKNPLYLLRQRKYWKPYTHPNPPLGSWKELKTRKAWFSNLSREKVGESPLWSKGAANQGTSLPSLTARKCQDACLSTTSSGGLSSVPQMSSQVPRRNPEESHPQKAWCGMGLKAHTHDFRASDVCYLDQGSGILHVNATWGSTSSDEATLDQVNQYLGAYTTAVLFPVLCSKVPPSNHWNTPNLLMDWLDQNTNLFLYA